MGYGLRTIGRPCPKLEGAEERITTLGHYRVPPACIYVFPATVPAPRNNPHPSAQEIDDVQMLKAFHNCFGGRADEINYVDFDVEYEIRTQSEGLAYGGRSYCAGVETNRHSAHLNDGDGCSQTPDDAGG